LIYKAIFILRKNYAARETRRGCAKIGANSHAKGGAAGKKFVGRFRLIPLPAGSSAHLLWTRLLASTLIKLNIVDL
jgi:hypothetical protein